VAKNPPDEVATRDHILLRQGFGGQEELKGGIYFEGLFFVTSRGKKSDWPLPKRFNGGNDFNFFDFRPCQTSSPHDFHLDVIRL
jgi:hypothetical protein